MLLQRSRIVKGILSGGAVTIRMLDTSLYTHAVRQKKLSIYLLEMISLPAVDGKHGWWSVVIKMSLFCD